MIFAVCGPMSPHLGLVIHLTRILLQQILGQVLHCHINTAEELRSSLADRKKGDPCLISFDCPEDIICQLISRTGLPTVLVLEPFQVLHAFAMGHHATDFYGACREVTLKLSSMHGLAGLSNVAVLKASDEEQIERLLRRIGNALGLSATDSHVRMALGTYFGKEIDTSSYKASSYRIPSMPASIESAISSYSTEERSILSRFARTYDGLLTEPFSAELNWPTETLHNADNNSPLSGPIDLIGPARILTFGPYLHIPKGRWKIVLAFLVKDNLSGNTLAVDVYAPLIDKVLVFARGQLPTEGAFSTSLEFSVDSCFHGLEIRTLIETGAIEGVLEIANVNLLPLR